MKLSYCFLTILISLSLWAQSEKPKPADKTRKSATKAKKAEPGVEPTLRLKNRQVKVQEQVDIAAWIHPDIRLLSLLLTTDTKSGKLLAYNLEGKHVDSADLQSPNHVDVRYIIPYKSKKVDLIAVNEMGKQKRLALFTVDPDKLKLVRIDNGKILLDPQSIGGCLYKSLRSGKLFYFSVLRSGAVHQFQLYESKEGYTGKAISKITLPKDAAEFCVVDDEFAYLYVAIKKKGVYRVPAEPAANRQAQPVLKVGSNNVDGDIEGLTLVNYHNGYGYLIVTDQKKNQFHLLDRRKNEYKKRFQVAHLEGTQGIFATNQDLGVFARAGAFFCTSNARTAHMVPWENISTHFNPPLKYSTRWNPRDPQLPPELASDKNKNKSSN